jgi:hypothetical protein
MRGYIAGIKAAIKRAYQSRKLAKSTIARPLLQVSAGLLDTVEGQNLRNRLDWEQYRVISEKYQAIDEPTRRAMAFSPKPGDYVDRAEWWIGFLHSALSPKEAAAAVVEILRWYRRCAIGEKTGIWKDIRNDWKGEEEGGHF